MVFNFNYHPALDTSTYVLLLHRLVTDQASKQPKFLVIIIIMIVMHRPQKEYDVHVLISYIYKLSACDS